MDYTARESTRGHSKNNENGEDDLEMEIRIDGELMIHVNHLQWKFRGNESIIIKKMRIEVYWDVHDWLFSPGLRNALFIIKPSSSTTLPPLLPTESPSSAGICKSVQGVKPLCSLEFCIFLYAWKVE
ncbi:protein phosphatase 2C [Tanacetum coccineum]